MNITKIMHTSELRMRVMNARERDAHVTTRVTRKPGKQRRNTKRAPSNRTYAHRTLSN